MNSRFRQISTPWKVIFLVIVFVNFVVLYDFYGSSVGLNIAKTNPDVFNQEKGYRVLREDNYQLVPENTEYADPPLILYNRVPKTGSTTLANIAYNLTLMNKFNMIHINHTYKNNHYFNVLDQHRFVSNISGWVEKIPAIYHGHIRFLDFTRFGYANPIYINIIRDPIERLVSYYYFLRYGDDYRPHLTRASAKDTTTLDECLVLKGKDCDLQKVMWLQVPFFCGQAAQCLVPDRWALEQAKNNLINHYLLVGVTEQLGDFIALLEAMLPRYFRGAFDLFSNGMGHLRRTKNKKPPSQESLDYIKQSKIYQLEQEFYLFAKEQFEFVKVRTMNKEPDGRVIINPPEFRYEKIFPPR